MTDYITEARARRDRENAAQIQAIEDGCRFCSEAITNGYTIHEKTRVLFAPGTILVKLGEGANAQYVAFHSECVHERTKTTREERACTGCGYKRKVKVSRHLDYRTALIEERAEEKCSACEAMGRARYYAQKSNAFHAKALKLYKKQGTSWRPS